jgi:hypothetical protein
VNGIVFAHENNNLLFSCAADSAVVLWDVRTSKPAARFPVPAGMVPTCLDVNTNDTVLAVGVEECMVLGLKHGLALSRNALGIPAFAPLEVLPCV